MMGCLLLLLDVFYDEEKKMKILKSRVENEPHKRTRRFVLFSFSVGPVARCRISYS